MTPPLRVLHVFGAMDRGGAEMRTLELMRRVDPDHIRLEFCALSGRAGTLEEEILALGGVVHPCVLDAGFPIRFARILKERRIDVVHSHVHYASGAILALARGMRVPTRIAHFRTTTDEQRDTLQRRTYRRTMKFLLDRCATAIVGCGECAIRESWSPAWRDDPRCSVILNGVDVNRFDLPDTRAEVRDEIGIPRDAPIVVQVGHFRRVKNQTRTLEIIASMQDWAHTHLVFLGKGGTPEEDTVRALVRERGLDRRVHMVGERRDVPRVLCASDALMLPSFNEGIPGAVLEAIAAGTPVIASDVPGVIEIAREFPEIAVLSLKAPNAAWAAAVAERLAHRPTVASRSSARSRFRTKPFSVEVSLAAHLALWRGDRT